jgi:hypothetical protein
MTQKIEEVIKTSKLSRLERICRSESIGHGSIALCIKNGPEPSIGLWGITISGIDTTSSIISRPALAKLLNAPASIIDRKLNETELARDAKMIHYPGESWFTVILPKVQGTEVHRMQKINLSSKLYFYSLYIT